MCCLLIIYCVLVSWRQSIECDVPSLGSQFSQLMYQDMVKPICDFHWLRLLLRIPFSELILLVGQQERCSNLY